MEKNHQNVLESFIKIRSNGVLLPKLFWPTVRKKCSSDREKLLQFEAECWEFANIWRLLKQFIQTVQCKVRTIFGKVQLFCEGHKNMRNHLYGFEIYSVNVRTLRMILQILAAFSEKLKFNRMLFTCSLSFLRFNRLEQLEFKLAKIIGI